MNETTITSVIAELEVKKNSVHPSKDDFEDGYIHALKYAISLLKASLPKEKAEKRADYEMGFNNGMNTEFGGRTIPFEEYFESTYKQ